MTPPPAGPRCDDSDLVLAARKREPRAYGELFERWYDRCYDVAWNIVRDRETAADIAQDVFLVAWEHLADLRDPAAFGGWILRTTRNRALNRLERERTRTHEPIETDDAVETTTPDHDADPAAQAEIHDRRRLVWTAASALGERDTSLLDLHLRHGLEPAEIAEELQITPNNAYQLLFRLRGKLKGTIGAALLWREGHPTCERLATLVPTQRRFDAGVAATIQRHQRTCRLCAGEVTRATHPERLFAAVPVAVAPALFRERAVTEFIAQGLPIEPSAPVAAAFSTSATSAASRVLLRPAHVAPLRVSVKAGRFAAGGALAVAVLVPVIGGVLPPGGQGGSGHRDGSSAVSMFPGSGEALGATGTQAPTAPDTDVTGPGSVDLTGGTQPSLSPTSGPSSSGATPGATTPGAGESGAGGPGGDSGAASPGADGTVPPSPRGTTATSRPPTARQPGGSGAGVPSTTRITVTLTPGTSPTRRPGPRPTSGPVVTGPFPSSRPCALGSHLWWLGWSCRHVPPGRWVCEPGERHRHHDHWHRGRPVCRWVSVRANVIR